MRIFLRLKHAVQLLACPAVVQLFILPDFVCKGDELALDFSHWRDVVQSRYRQELSAEQDTGLNEIDHKLKTITKWSDEDVRTTTAWEDIRQNARQLLAAFEWPQDTPPSYAHEYVTRDPRAKSYFQ